MNHTISPWEDFAPTIDGVKRDYYRTIKGGVGYFDVTEPEYTAGFHITGFILPADARLMASAPELLDMLKRCAEQFQTYELHHAQKGDVEKANFNGKLASDAFAVIAKACGENNE